ncbi:NAD(P)/FAD-dependent oxidoreductase [Winogradskya consettensis]|uniref:Hydroxylase n=1 Tax=Winogradskya consettensis TaxID=113560 RepID=A0A919T2E4_9ACTN|nr:NAD(P)/FAD-dependent oxidoreductase [Actinoplanes consettensis]GIM85402.1 hydroxylase [Actinoplanes consettensis]
MAESAQPHATRFDVIVIGAGPAGSTTAATLAKEGRSVLVLERRAFPRFHIGESMLPPTMLILKEMGALERVMARGYPVKLGAEFTGGRQGRFGRIPFAGQGPGRQHATFQTERADYDKVLCDFAGDCGATVLHEAVVGDLVIEDGRVVGVQYEHEGGTHTAYASYVVDAAGRSSKAAQTFGLRRSGDRRRMVAVFRHFGDLDESRNPGTEGDIQIGEHLDGWVWAIPIGKDRISVGACMPREVLQRAEDREALYTDHVSRVGRIQERLAGTRPLIDVTVETDYMYYADEVAGPGWFMVGDSGCFFDPIFSAGVFLAMVTGRRAARTIGTLLDDPALETGLQQEYSRFYKTGYDMYARLIYAYYEAGYSLRGLLKNAGFDISGDELGDNKWVARLVSGDFWNPRNVLVQYLRGQERFDTFAEFEPLWGCPFYEDLNIAEEAEELVS